MGSEEEEHRLVTSFCKVTGRTSYRALFGGLANGSVESFGSLGISCGPRSNGGHFPKIIMDVQRLMGLPVVIGSFRANVGARRNRSHYVITVRVGNRPGGFFAGDRRVGGVLLRIGRVPSNFPFRAAVGARAFNGNQAGCVFA